MKLTVTEKALRDLVNEALNGGTQDGHLARDITLGSPPVPDEDPVNVNATVDPSACETDPINPNFTPQNKQEFDVAVRNLVKNLPDDQMSGIFAGVKDVVVDQERKQEKQMTDKMNDKQPSADDKDQTAKKAEEAVRREVRKLIAEAGYTQANMVQADQDQDDDEPHSKRKFSGVSDVDGATFEEIAKDLGFSVAGAKQAVDKALDKARFLANMDNDDMEILVLTAMNDYIKMLAKTGELSSADVALMKDHPEIVRDLDGFREFLHNHVRRARREAGSETGE